MALSDAQVKEWAARLREAERSRSTLPPLTAAIPELTAADAYAIQLAGIDAKRREGRKVVGKKIGLTSQAMQRMLNVDQPDYGHILDDMIVEDGGEFPVGNLIQPKIEPEIAFILDRDLKGPGVTAVQVLAATRFVMPALEIIDSRIEGWKIKLCDTIADNASSARVVLGGTPRRVDQLDLKLIGMVLEKNGRVAQTGAGAAVLGHPANAVAWLANAIGEFGVTLQAGEVVMPGAISAAVDVAAGDLLRASFDGLGTVSVRFV
jgi:2-keto-4-pentenoate hydratase